MKTLRALQASVSNMAYLHRVTVRCRLVLRVICVLAMRRTRSLKFRELFRNDAREDMTMDNRAYDSNGRRYQMLWECANAQIAESPRAEVTGQGPIERPLVFRALPGAGNVPEIVVTMYSSVALYT